MAVRFSSRTLMLARCVFISIDIVYKVALAHLIDIDGSLVTVPALYIIWYFNLFFLFYYAIVLLNLP